VDKTSDRFLPKIGDIKGIFPNFFPTDMIKRLHLESSKKNYYVISLRAIIKAIFTKALLRGTSSINHTVADFEVLVLF